MHAVLQPVVVIHQGAAVHKAGLAQHRIGIDNGPVQDQTALSQNSRGADNGGRMDHAGHSVSGFQQLFRPGKAQTVVAECRYCLRIFARQRKIVRTAPDHRRTVHRIIQKSDLIPTSLRGSYFANHAAQTTRAENQKLRHEQVLLVLAPLRAQSHSRNPLLCGAAEHCLP